MDAEKYIQARLEFIRRNSTYGLIFGKDYERHIECQLVRSVKEATDEEIQEILGKKGDEE